MTTYIDDELNWLNTEARKMTENLTRAALDRLGPQKFGEETFDVFDAYLYARTVLGKSLAQHRRLFSEDRELDDSTKELYSRELAEKDMYSARTRRVVSGKLTRIIKKYRIEHEEQREENDSCFVQNYQPG